MDRQRQKNRETTIKTYKNQTDGLSDRKTNKQINLLKKHARISYYLQNDQITWLFLSTLSKHQQQSVWEEQTLFSGLFDKTGIK